LQVEENAMTDQPPVPAGAADQTRQRPPGRSAPSPATPSPAEATTRTPRWVKVFGVIGVVVVLLIVVMLLTGHGPGQHMHSGLRADTPAAGLARGAVTASDGH
jgi:hypothetical protein